MSNLWEHSNVDSQCSFLIDSLFFFKNAPNYSESGHPELASRKFLGKTTSTFSFRIKHFAARWSSLYDAAWNTYNNIHFTGETRRGQGTVAEGFRDKETKARGAARGHFENHAYAARSSCVWIERHHGIGGTSHDVMMEVAPQ